MDLQSLRREYRGRPLGKGDVDPDPLRQFASWFADAVEASKPLREAGLQPHAMALATADAEGRPTVRYVLLRSHDERGFVFYSDYESRKGHDLAVNPHASLVLYWALLDRQVRIEGTVERLSREESRTYFHSRPRGSQLSAAASRQSAPIESRDALEAELDALTEEVGEEAVPLPERWGGYRLSPTRIELWQGREGRLHDRLAYLRNEDGGWRVERLQP